MTQLALELDKKNSGMTLAAGNNAIILAKFRDIAERLGRTFVNVTIDNIREDAENAFIPYEPGNWMGSVFKGPNWKCVGFRISTHYGSHGRIVRVWEWRG
jgi:hypothetical protein